MTTFDWSRFLVIADDLLTEGQPRLREAASRSAVSRAYYAAFHGARLRLEAEGKTFPTNGTAHGLVIRGFFEGDAARKRIGKLLSQLITDRHEADYSADASVDASARESVEQARLILKLLHELPPVPAP